MDTKLQHQTNTREERFVGELSKQQGEDLSAAATTITKQQQQQQQQQVPTNSYTSSPASSPSASSSPTHEFSFTISLHSSSTATTQSSQLLPNYKTKSDGNNNNTTNNNSNNPFAIDLSPADDIFFHGHLLPLHLLSHLPVSPRSSTNSLDRFTLPIRDLLDDQKPNNNTTTTTTINCTTTNNTGSNQSKNGETTKERFRRNTNKPFSIFGWRKGCEDIEDKDQEDNKEKQKKKLRFDLSHAIKRYARMVRPILFFRGGGGGGGRRENVDFHRGAYSFSGTGSLSWRSSNNMMRGRRGEFSAPASTRTSPSNSGLLIATPPLCSSTSDHSTMEELQAAIQAAIAHCKNSINDSEGKIKW